MGLQDSLDALSRVVEQFESRGRTVRDVEVTTDPDRAGSLAVELTAPVSLCAAADGTLDSSLTPERASLTADGGLSVAFSVSTLLPEPTAGVVTGEERAVHVEEGELIMTISFYIRSGDGSEDAVPAGQPATEPSEAVETTVEESRTETDEIPDEADDALAARLQTVRSDDVPPYDDTDYLRALYESCETFTEMRDRIEMDVAAETVRRYMIEAGIHDPTSYDTDEEASGTDDATRSSPSVEESTAVPDRLLVTDGIGLPDGVTVESIVNAVVDATAVYEVQRSLDIDHDQTRALLRQLNVLDLVVHRIDGPDRPASKNEVVDRIRQTAVSEG